MEHVKELLKMPSEELRANVQVCLEHSCAIFLGNYEGLGHREGLYLKDMMNIEKGEPNQSDIEFKAILEVFQATTCFRPGVARRTWVRRSWPCIHCLGKCQSGTEVVPVCPAQDWQRAVAPCGSDGVSKSRDGLP